MGRLRKIASALSKKVKGPTSDPRVKQAYEKAKKDALVEEAKKKGRAKGKQLAGRIDRSPLPTINFSRANAGLDYLNRDMFDIGLNPTASNTPTSTRKAHSRIKKSSRKATTITVDGHRITIQNKKKKRKVKVQQGPKEFNPLDY